MDADGGQRGASWPTAVWATANTTAVAPIVDAVDADIRIHTDEESVIEQVTAGSVDVVISAQELPTMEGLTLLDAVRNHEPTMPFVLVPAGGHEALASAAVSAGVTEYHARATLYETPTLLEWTLTAITHDRTRTDLRSTARRFNKLLEEAADIIVVLDPDGTIEYVTPSVTAITGYTPTDLIGENAFDCVHPDDRETVRQSFEEAKAGPAAESAGSQFRFRRADGDGWVELTAWTRNRTDDPDIGGFVTYVRDITERRQRERRFRSLIEESTDIFTVVDADGEVQYVSPSVETHLGYDPDAHVGENAFDCVHRPIRVDARPARLRHRACRVAASTRRRRLGVARGDR
jgi:PAS domain S-box-containing protein